MLFHHVVVRFWADLCEMVVTAKFGGMEFCLGILTDVAHLLSYSLTGNYSVVELKGYGTPKDVAHPFR